MRLFTAVLLAPVAIFLFVVLNLAADLLTREGDEWDAPGWVR